MITKLFTLIVLTAVATAQWYDYEDTTVAMPVDPFQLPDGYEWLEFQLSLMKIGGTTPQLTEEQWLELQAVMQADDFNTLSDMLYGGYSTAFPFDLTTSPSMRLIDISHGFVFDEDLEGELRDADDYGSGLEIFGEVADEYYGNGENDENGEDYFVNEYFEDLGSYYDESSDYFDESEEEDEVFEILEDYEEYEDDEEILENLDEEIERYEDMVDNGKDSSSEEDQPELFYGEYETTTSSNAIDAGIMKAYEDAMLKSNGRKLVSRSRTSTSVWLILGPVIGALAFIMLAVGIACMCCKRKQHSGYRKFEDDGAEYASDKKVPPV